MIRALVSVQSLLETIYEDYYTPENLSGSPPETHQENRRFIRLFGEFLGRPATIDDLDKPALVGYRTWRLDRGAMKGKDVDSGQPRRLSPATVNKELRIGRALWRFAWDEEFPGVAPPRKIRELREPKRKPEAYSVEAIAAVLASAMLETEEFGGVPSSLWWCAILAAFYDTGYRRKTLLQSKWSNFDPEARILRRPAEEQKDDEDGAQELHPDTVALLDRIRQPERSYIWPWPFRSHGPWYVRLHRIVKRANLSRPPRKPTHGLRASHATYLFSVAGIEAAATSCNHSSSQVTRDSYIDATLLETGRNASRLPRPAMPQH